MTPLKLRRGAQVATLLVAIAILYVTLAPEPPHWGTFMADATATPATPGALAPSLSPPPGWMLEEEEAAGHALLFALLGLFISLWYATSPAARRAPQRTLVMVMLGMWLFGGLTEWAQSVTPTRSAQLSDLAFDVLGAFVGFLGGSALWRLLLTRTLNPRRP